MLTHARMHWLVHRDTDHGIPCTSDESCLQQLDSTLKFAST